MIKCEAFNLVFRLSKRIESTTGLLYLEDLCLRILSAITQLVVRSTKQSRATNAKSAMSAYA